MGNEDEQINNSEEYIEETGNAAENDGGDSVVSTKDGVLEEEKNMETTTSAKTRKKKIRITAIIAAAVIAAVYLCGAAFYSNHFFFGTEIGSFSCSNMTAQEASEKIKSDIENYRFTFYEKDGVEEYVTGEEIGLKCTPVENIDELLAEQNPFLWVTAVKGRSLPLETEVTFVKDTLYNRVTQLSFAKASREGAQGAASGIYYEDGAYRIADNTQGNIVSVNDVYQRAKSKIKGLYLGMSLEKEGCYTGLEGEDTVKGVLNLANKFVSSRITYKRGDESTVLDGNTIKDWVVIGDNSVNLDSAKVREFVDSLAPLYNTVGMERMFKASNGEEVAIKGGDYGWRINCEKETNELAGLIWNGETAEREPVYSQKAQVHGTKCDVGGTYVEVSIGAQHMWYYKDGKVVIETDLVSGDPTRGNSTPTGVYKLKYKDKNVVLKGEDYETPVSFWMPFNGGVGLHDATWRGAFGGRIYRGSGSHGCVNLPYSVAKTLYESLSPGDPVVVY